jgi:hypothetical protein
VLPNLPDHPAKHIDGQQPWSWKAKQQVAITAAAWAHPIFSMCINGGACRVRTQSL